MRRVTDIALSRARTFLAFQRDPLRFLVDTLRMGEVISLRSGKKRPSYIVHSPAFIHEILVAHDASFRKGRSSDVLRRTIGEGLLTAEDEQHRRQRQYLQPVFYKERLQAYARVITEETERLADKLKPGRPLSLSDAMMELTLTIIARTMFAADVGPRTTELARAVNETIERTARLLFSPFPVPLAVPTPGNVRHRRAIGTLETMVYDTIKEAKQSPERYANTMLGLLLATQKADGSPLPEVEIRDQMMTMLLAGHETTANLLSWVWLLLEAHPEAEARIQAEADLVCVTGDNAFEAYRSLVYTHQVVQETLRLYPPAWVILRESRTEVTMLGERFAAGSSFLISPYAIHRNSRVFAEAEAFKPERFEGGAGQWPRFTYFPFGGGGRGCIGSGFAMLEAVLIIAVLARRFSFRRADNGPVRPEPLVSLRIRGGLTMIPYERGEGRL